MTDADAPHGNFLPPKAADVASHEVAAARAQAAAAARVQLRTGIETPAVAGYTGLVTRALGFGIDAIIIDLAAVIVVAIVALALSLFYVPTKVVAVLAALGAIAFFVWAAAYFVTFWSTTGQTPGARIMRFRVVAPGAQDGRIAPRRALVRLVGMILAAIPLLAGYFMVLIDDRRRGLHDRLARTVVIDASAAETPANRRRAKRRPPPA